LHKQQLKKSEHHFTEQYAKLEAQFRHAKGKLRETEEELSNTILEKNEALRTLESKAREILGKDEEMQALRRQGTAARQRVASVPEKFTLRENTHSDYRAHRQQGVVSMPDTRGPAARGERSTPHSGPTELTASGALSYSA
jgi:chromosome segregation ATPase